jgi:hypothetical protein
MISNTTEPNKDPLADAPTPDRDVPGLTALSRLAEGDRIELDTHDAPLIVVDTAARERRTKRGHVVDQHAIAAESTHHAGGTVELVEAINRINGSVIEILDRDDQTPVRVFADE